MPENMNNSHGEFVGISEAYYALVTADDQTAYTAAAPNYLAPSGSATYDPASSVAVTYYDNAAFNAYASESGGTVKVVVSGVPSKKAAELAGYIYDSTKGVVYENGAPNPPFVALGIKVNKGPSAARYYWYQKGVFTLGSEEAETKGENITPKTRELTFTPLKTVHKFQLDADMADGVKRVYADSDDSVFTGAANWFSAVQTPPEVLEG